MDQTVPLTHLVVTREVYSPMSAVLKQAGIDFRIRRPKGSRGRELTGWLWPEEAERLLAEAHHIDPEFGLLCLFLLYTGLRLSEGTLRFTCDRLRLSEAYPFIPTTKNGEPHAHTVVSEEAKRAELLPTPKIKFG